MITDHQPTDPDLNRQLELLGQHRERQTMSGPVIHQLAPEPDRRLAVLAAAAVTLVLLVSGAYFSLRTDPQTAAVDAVGGGETDRTADPQPSDKSDDGAGPSEGSDQRGVFLPPNTPADPETDSTTADVDSAPNTTMTTTTITAADSQTSDDTATTAVTDSTTATTAGGGGSTSTTSTVANPVPDPDDLSGVDEASVALSDSMTAMVELTAGMAGGGDDSTGGTTSDERQVANDLAAGVVGDHPDCATPSINPDLSLTVTLVNCRAEDGRPMNGAITTKVKRWLPFEVRVVISELVVGADRLWMDATMTFPLNGDPVLQGAIATESKGDVTHLEGTALFRNGRTILDAEVGHVTDTSVIGGNRVTYRPGQTIVSATVSGLTVREGGCAPSSGTAAWTVYTVTGIRGGGSETTSLEQLELAEELSAAVTYRPNTPIDGRVDLQVGNDRSDHRLVIGC